MHNYIILSAARTGSTYLTSAISKQIRCMEPNLFYGGEFFNWREYFQLNRAGVAGPGSLDIEDNPQVLEEYEQTQPTGEGYHVYLGEGGRLISEHRETEWNERAPVNFRRAWEESQRRLTLLDNCDYPWVIKVHPEHLRCMDMRRFDRLVQRDNTKVVLLYRSSLWDWFLSWVAVQRTGIFQQSQQEQEWNKPEIQAVELRPSIMKNWYITARELVNISLSYRNQTDHIITYESFSGDPKRDAGSVTGIGLFPEHAAHPVKLWSKEEKEQMIANIDEIKKLFLAYCKALGYSGGKLFF
ncbi:MAG: hypothetical protein PVI97_19160 [Candidatus Thiodiazotropha sp.]|jgi:hypothetical protein